VQGGKNEAKIRHALAAIRLYISFHPSKGLHVSRHFTWDRASALLFLSLVLLVAATFGHYGNGFDAEVQDVYGRQIVSWYATLGHDRSALTYLDLYYYGGLFDTLAALVNLISPWGHWATRHLLEAISGLIGMVGCWAVARRLGGPLAGFAALALLALMPSYYGMMFINPKDIPFAALMIWAVYLLTRIADELPRPSSKLIAAFGLVAGLTLGVRIGGVLLFVYLGLLVLATPGNRLSMALRLAPALPVAWLVMLIFWPWAMVSPIAHPWEAFRHFSAMNGNIGTLFFGHMVGLTYHPAYYLPVYMAVKLPDLVLLLLAAGAAIGVTRLRTSFSRPSLPVLLAALFPILYTLATNPQLYDAERHFLFVLPALAVLAGLAAAKLAEYRWKPVFAAASIFLAGLQLVQMAALHPYEYAFFNDLVGGTEHAAGLFETEYWGASLAEATEDLSQYLATHHLDGPKPWRVAVCGKPSQMGDETDPHIQATGDWQHADFFVATTRGACDQRLRGREIGEVQRDGVPFAVIKDLRHGGAG
jgi:hypothetical protein